MLGELIVRQTLTPTRDHLPNSPYSVPHIAACKLKGEFAFDQLLVQDILGIPVQSEVSLPICIVVAYEYMSMVLSVSQNPELFTRIVCCKWVL